MYNIDEIKNKIICGDSLIELRKLPNESVDCCITSPPYWGLRDYGVAGQIGLEKTPEEYVAKMVEIFGEVKRVLKKEGTLWLNLGDSYAGSMKGSNGSGGFSVQSELQKGNIGSFVQPVDWKNTGLKSKDLVGIPWRVAFALQADGWYLRQDIIWAKPNPMPESVTDRCTKSHEYIFLLAKSPKYYFDNGAIMEKATTEIQERKRINGQSAEDGKKSGRQRNCGVKMATPFIPGQQAQVRKEAHFATFPEDLIVPMVLAGCPKEVCKKCGKARERISEKVSQGKSYSVGKSKEKNEKGLVTGFSGYDDGSSCPKYKTIGFTDCGCNVGFSAGIVLDPFMGAGTTAVVAKKLGRNYLGLELNEKYVKMAEERIRRTPTPLF